jgi:DNA protecting protein DprA
MGTRPLPLFHGGVDVGDAAYRPATAPSAESAKGLPSEEAGAAVTPEFGLHLLALAQVRGVGVQALRALIRHYGNLELVWLDDPKHVAAVLHDARLQNGLHLADVIRLEHRQLLVQGAQEQDRLRRNGYRVIGAHEAEFPTRLKGLPGRPPMWLFVEGDTAALKAPPLVAVVGTREASEQGADTARHLTRLVADAGLGIVSGLAEGIDHEAHMIAARQGVRQVAVLGTGIEVMFPAMNTQLRRHIVETGGAVVTEYLPAEKYGKSNFVQRNRVQAGLAAAVCPVEGRMQSGTSHTVRFAREYGRIVFGATRGAPHPANELFKSLVDEGAPGFDLATEDGRRSLRRLLAGIEGQRGPTPPPRDKQFWIRPALAKLAELRSYYDLTLDEKRRIVDEVAATIGLDGARDERPDGD